MAEFPQTNNSPACRRTCTFLSVEDVSCTPRDLLPGCKICAVGRIPAGAYLIQSGAVGLQTRDSHGLYFEVLGPGDVVGLSETVGEHPFLVNAIVLKPTSAMFIARDELTRLIRTNPAAALQILDAVAKRATALLKVTAELKAGHRESRTNERESQSDRD